MVNSENMSELWRGDIKAKLDEKGRDGLRLQKWRQGQEAKFISDDSEMLAVYHRIQFIQNLKTHNLTLKIHF